LYRSLPAHPCPPFLPAPLPACLPCSIWGAPLNVAVAVDVIMLATGLLQQQAIGDPNEPASPRMRRGMGSSSRATSVALSHNGDLE
jgi:hypothetical protein